VQPVIGHIDRLGRIRIFIGGGIERDRRIIGIMIVPVIARLWIFQVLEFDHPLYRQLVVMVEVDDLEMLGLSDRRHRIGKLLQLLPVLFLIRAPGVVCMIGDIDEIASLHRRNKNDPRIRVERAQLIDDDPVGAKYGTGARAILIIGEGTQLIGMPPVIGAQENGIHISFDDAKVFDLVSDLFDRPAIVTLAINCIYRSAPQTVFPLLCIFYYINILIIIINY